METGRWTNNSQPQTLQIAVFLLYFTAFFGALSLFSNLRHGFWGILLALTVPGSVLAARGIASERKWGYQLGVAMAIFPFIFRVLSTRNVNALLGTDLINLMFEIALVALLLHTQSREYQRIWFK
jgi:hypothetical protein